MLRGHDSAALHHSKGTEASAIDSAALQHSRGMDASAITAGVDTAGVTEVDVKDLFGRRSGRVKSSSCL